MRPLLVLILVIAALGAFYLAFNTGDSAADQNPGLAPESRVTTSSKAPAEAELAAPAVVEKEDRRVQAQVDMLPPPERSERDGFQNRLTGRVVDERGAPIAGARVVLTKWGRSTFFFTEDDGSWDRSDDRSARTNEDGVYTIDNVPPFTGRALIATHADYGSTEVGEVSVEERGLFEEPPIVMRPGHKISGVISDVGGAIVPGASIILSPPNMGAEDLDSPETKRATADETGYYEIKSVTPGQYSMTVTADGYGRVIVQKVQVQEDLDLELPVELDVAQMIAGRVISMTGEGIPKAIVQAYSLPGRGQMSRSQTTSDENGEFRFEDIPAGAYTIMAKCDGYNNVRKQRIETGTMSLSLELAPLPAIHGTVLDALTGKPVAGCQIRLRQPGAQGEVSMPVNAIATKSRKDGTFSIYAPSPGNYLAEAGSADYATSFSEPFSIAKGQSLNDVVVRVTHGGRISGRIVDSSGKGIGGVLIETHDNDWTDDQFMRALGDMYPTNATTRQVRTKASGEFVISNLTPATYLLHIKHEEYSTTTRRDLRVVETQEAQAGDVVLESGAELSGTVYGPSGEPLAGSVVQLMMQPLVNEFPEHYTAKTNAQGMYRFRHVRKGSYSIKAMRSAEAGADPFAALGDMKESQRKIDIQEGENYAGIDFRLAAGR